MQPNAAFSASSAALHQYDRRKQLVDTLGARYALVDKPEPPPRTSAPVDTAAAFDGRGFPQQQQQEEPRLLDGRIGVDADNLAP